MSPASPPALPAAPSAPRGARGTDLLRWPVLGPFLRWRHARLALQLPLLALAGVLVVHGLAGPQLAPRNLATVVTWVHYRGALVLALLVAGNLFCMACPFLVPRDLARRWFTPRLDWPRALRGKWVAIALLVLVLFGYERFDWWSSPSATALLIAGFFVGALAVDGVFKHASFCRYVCPLGQFNFTTSTLSPLEVRVADRDTCERCATKDCIRGRRAPSGAVVVRGCELALYLPEKHGNLDCTFCLDCVHACPHDNVAIATRLPGGELWDDRRRAGVGQPSRRPDLALFVVVFTFGALLNAFGMVSPVYAVQAWLAARLPGAGETTVLGTLFGLGLVVEPVLLLGAAAWATRRATGRRDPLLAVVARHVNALVPIGVAVWLAHYAFHFLTGFPSVVPVVQSTLADLGVPFLGAPAWGLRGLPERVVYPMELGVLTLGLIGAWLVAWRIAEREAPARPRAAFVPWATLALVLFVTAVWLLSQPMEMRGVSLP